MKVIVKLAFKSHDEGEETKIPFLHQWVNFFAFISPKCEEKKLKIENSSHSHTREARAEKTPK